MYEKFDENIGVSENLFIEPTIVLKDRISAPPTLKSFRQNTLLPQISLQVHHNKESSSELFNYDTPTIISVEEATQASKVSCSNHEFTKTPSWVHSSPSWQYTAEEEIARGGMGIIFKGHQVVLNREVALKTLLPETIDECQREHFIEESRITAYLDHPNIVPVYDLGTNENGEIILVMKMIKGTSWRELMQQYPPQEHLEKHLDILLQVCNAVAFAHNKKIVHNDLKPDNVMVGEFGEIFVMDWGIATSIVEPIEKNPFRVHKQHIDSARGTPMYMPPELAEGRGADIGPWTDIYLLGGILYEILSGHPPHEGKTLSAIIAFILTERPKELPSHVPKELQQICLKALEKPIQERYSSVFDFKESLQQFLKHRESILITEDAKRLLGECPLIQNRALEQNATEFKTEMNRNILYERYAEAIAGFRQALKLHKENETAQAGEWNARFKYAKAALCYNDFGLAETQLKQIPIDRPEHEQLKTVLRQTEEERRVQSISQRISLIHFLVLLTVVPEIFLAVGIKGYFWWSGQNHIAGTTLSDLGISYPLFQFFNTLLFLSISFGFYFLFKRRLYGSKTLLLLSVAYQILGVYFLSLSCLIVMDSNVGQIGSIYLCGIWILLFPLMFPYSTKLSYIGAGLSASSIFLVFATLWLFHELPEFDIAIILVLGYYFFAIVASFLGCRKQHLYDLFSHRLGL